MSLVPQDNTETKGAELWDTLLLRSWFHAAEKQFDSLQWYAKRGGII